MHRRCGERTLKHRSKGYFKSIVGWSLAARLTGRMIVAIDVYLCTVTRMEMVLRALDRLHLSVITIHCAWQGSRPPPFMSAIEITFTLPVNSDFTSPDFFANPVLPVSECTLQFSSRLAFNQKIRNHRTPFIFTLVFLLRFSISTALLRALVASSFIRCSGTILDLQLRKCVSPRPETPIWIALSMFRLSNKGLSLPYLSFLSGKGFPVFTCMRLNQYWVD
jgi:hypothetical protein